MEENTILSNAEEQNTPQENETSKTEGKKELVTVSKTAIKVVKKTNGIILAGIIIATVKLGADNAQMAIGIPKVVTGLFEGILLFFLLTGETLQKYQIAWKKYGS